MYFDNHKAYVRTYVYATWFWKTNQIVTFGVLRNTDF